MFQYLRRLASLGLALAILVPLPIATAGPAAAASTECAVWANAPWDDNTYVYSYAAIRCDFVPGVNAVKVRASVQEKVLSVWTVRSSSYAYGNTAMLAKTASYNCNGHGTDTYKSRSTGWDSDENYKTRYSSQASLEC